jgi:transcriptional regulator with XRE-family HTH domain
MKKRTGYLGPSVVICTTVCTKVEARVGTSHTVIGRIESGQHTLNVKTFERLADALNMRLLIRLEYQRYD